MYKNEFNIKTQLVSVSKLKNNNGQINGLPKNPRILKDDKYDKLKKSIIDNPEMLSIREVIAYDNDGELVVIAGNMRLKACKDLGIKEIPTKILDKDTHIEKLKAYTIKDNSSFGEWDFELLANDWDIALLGDFGIDIPNVIIDLGTAEAKKEPEQKEKYVSCPECGKEFDANKNRT